MSDLLVYNSKDTRFKTPYGAVPEGERVSFRVRPLRSAGYSWGQLLAKFESRGDEIATTPMVLEDLEGERDVFAAQLETQGYVGLVWYSFRLTGIDGRQEELGPYQLTVYDGAEEVPDWFGQGLCYQIFPDRFHRTHIPDPAGMVGGRWVHQSWQEEPAYLPNEKGEIRNRDFFGGNLAGVTEKLDYLKEMGVETLYFCPIFEAAENHRYGTADYSRVDPMLGCNEDFTNLCDQAHRRGMKVMLDGVFNHTGFVSSYFNGDGFYQEAGACQSQDSRYYPWFNFTNWPDKYESWWGIYSLPAVDEGNQDYRNFIFGDENSVVRSWLRAGADGWRLDVADEIPDDFVAGIHAAARKEKPHAVVVGEVWEDGSTKVAYGVRRKHILGGHCDGLMNYPLRSAILDYFQGGDAANFVSTMETIRENYPPFAFHSAMNSLGTHDTPRIITLLGVGSECRDQSRDWRAHYRLTDDQRRRGKERLFGASLLLYCFPGSPTVYYGDEVGMEGFEDPFNRQTYPWGHEDSQIQNWFRDLGKLRGNHPALRCGDIRYVAGEGSLLAFLRSCEEETLLVALNAGETDGIIPLPEDCHWKSILGNCTITEEDGVPMVHLTPRSGAVLKLVE